MKTQNVAIEGQHRSNVGDIDHRVPHAQWARPETGDGTPRNERLDCDMRFPENLDGVTAGILERDEIGDMTLVCHRCRMRGDARSGRFQAGSQCQKIGFRRDLPTEKSQAIPLLTTYHKPLLPVVHPEGTNLRPPIDLLHPQQSAREA